MKLDKILSEVDSKFNKDVICEYFKTGKMLVGINNDKIFIADYDNFYNISKICLKENKIYYKTQTCGNKHYYGDINEIKNLSNDEIYLWFVKKFKDGFLFFDEDFMKLIRSSLYKEVECDLGTNFLPIFTNKNILCLINKINFSYGVPKFGVFRTINLND